MKKFSKVLLFSFYICLMISLTACGNKTALIANEFKTKMEKRKQHLTLVIVQNIQ